jgi:GT2 family glycosyltransferase
MRIALCTPGESFTPSFIRGLVNTITILASNGIEILHSQKSGSLVATVRNMTAGGAAQLGRMQKPFNGKVRYDYMLWIDSDQGFAFDDLAKLMERKRDICAGWYKTVSGNSSVGLTFDIDKFRKTGAIPLMAPEAVKKQKTPFKVDFVGFGFVLIAQGVFEKIPYPWFSHDEITMENGVVRQLGEDFTFCRKARDAGFSIWVDPDVRVSHSKLYEI